MSKSRRRETKNEVMTHAARAGKRVILSAENRRERKDKALVKRMWNEELLA